MNDELEYALTPNEISKIVGDKIKLVLYPDLKYVENIDDILDHNDSFVLLYQTDDNFGHYNLILKNPNGDYEVFDSYGYEPDEKLKLMEPYFRSSDKHLYPHLSYLLLKATEHNNKKIHYNNNELQERDNHKIGTCGRWVAWRLKHKDIPVEKFASKFKNKKNPDKEIVKLTRKYI